MARSINLRLAAPATRLAAFTARLAASVARLIAPVAVVLLAALAVSGPATGTATAAAGASVRPSLSVEPALSPAFAWNRSDYAVRCGSEPVKISVNAPAGWQAQVGQDASRTGQFEVSRQMQPGRAFAVGFSNGAKRVKTFFARCLPPDFPEYTTSSNWVKAPRLTLLEMTGEYAAAFDRNGAPVWWRKMEGAPVDIKFLPDGTVSYAPVKGIEFRRIVIRSLTGRKLRVIQSGPGTGTDLHDLQPLANGNFLLGSHRWLTGIDTSKFGGPSRANLDTAQVQEIDRRGRVVWKWNAWPRIKLSETGRWWGTLNSWGQPFDIHHWNSIDRKGDLILLSFRHLDAVFCIDRRSGRILWKLGGKRTAKSLRVLGDPRRNYPLGGQHDARFAPDGTITVFDNSTNLSPARPRAVRYKINWKRRTARLVSQVVDPEVDVSVAFGSARVDSRGNWVVGWGANGATGTVGGYGPTGRVRYRLQMPGASYRATPVYGKVPSIETIRRAMARMAVSNG